LLAGVDRYTNSFIRATRRGGGTPPSDAIIRSEACTTDMIKAAATPLPDTSASAMPIPRSRSSTKS
jgi:hypothetical protein